MWGWSGSELSPEHPFLSDECLQGIGDPGAGYNTYRWREIAYLLQISRSFKQLDRSQRQQLADDPWKFASWLAGVPKQGERQFRHILCYLVFPAAFERITIAHDKLGILLGVGNQSAGELRDVSDLEIDQRLANLRNKLAADRGSNDFDFYQPDLRSRWKDADSGAWLLSWNPRNWHWRNFEKDRFSAANGQPAQTSWSCVNHEPKIGDTVYLIRVGVDPRGIIARGTVLKPPYSRPHYDPAKAAEGKEQSAIDVEFTEIRDPARDAFLPTSELEREIPNQVWSPRASGIAISSGAAQKLEKLWRELPPVVPGTPPQQTSASGIGDDLNRFMEIYAERRSGPFATDPALWTLLKEIEQKIRSLPAVASRPTIQVTWSVGQGNWARVPWVALLDSRVTDSTQRGVYGVFLFREDMSGVYLTLNQGVTEPKKKSGPTAGLQLLRNTAVTLRRSSANLQRHGFKLDDSIDLRTEGTLGRDYEAATIAHKFYKRGEMPTDNEIAEDIEALLSTYASVTSAGPPETGKAVKPSPYNADDALKELFLSELELAELLGLWNAKKNLLLQGPPGVGKTYIARRLAYVLIGEKDPNRVQMIQFHQAYGYEDFIQGYRPTETGGFTRVNGAFYEFSKLAEGDLERPYVFIIDEINRGNLSKIFGELMMLIEPDKRGSEYAIRLAYGRLNEAPFSVPPNLFLMGLMNTADRSLAMVDYALRRRFVFHTLQPQFSSPKFRALLEARGATAKLLDTIISRMNALNAEIAKDTVRLGPGYQIGHSFFVPADSTVHCDLDWYRRIVQHEIRPLLNEYWFDNLELAETWTASLLEGAA